ncbi:MAG: hypothetical protein WCA23_31745 [Stellaceae bacterium]
MTAHMDLLRAAFRQVRARHPFTIEAAVVLPDHLHAIWTLPGGDADFATRWRLIKSGFSHALPSGEPISASRAAKAARGFGSGDIGSIRCAMMTIFRGTSITFTSIRYNTATPSACAIGHFPRFAAGCASAPIRWIGPAIPAMK